MTIKQASGYFLTTEHANGTRRRRSSYASTAGRPSRPGTGSSPRLPKSSCAGCPALDGSAVSLRSCVGPFQSEDWWEILPDDAPLLTVDRWDQRLNELTPEVFSDGKDHRPLLQYIVKAIRLGLAEAEAIGEALFKDSEALGIWKRALLEGPPAALDVSLAMLRIQDEIEPGAAVVWGPASAIAAFPRPFCRLVGLTSRSWPRRAGEDPLLPTHVMPQERLDPLPIHESDRRDFGTICRMADHEVVCSRARQDSEGRLNGVSPLYPQDREKEPLAQSRAPEHAASQGDRLAARPREFTALPLARSATRTWIDWRSEKLTAHDGLIRQGHPMLLRALERTQSASSLVRLLRDPLGYLWTYGFGWKAPEETEEPLTLDALAFGGLLHEILQQAVTRMENAETGGFAGASRGDIEHTAAWAATEVAERWAARRPVPPPVIWELGSPSIPRPVLRIRTRSFIGCGMTASISRYWATQALNMKVPCWRRSRNSTGSGRVRLWYVALTRARDLLLLPRQSERVNRDWMSLIDVDVESLPVFDTGRFGGMPTLPDEPARNRQDATTWLREEEAIAAGQRRITWRRPSRHDDAEQIEEELPPAVFAGEEEAKESTDPEAGGSPVHPALKRGLILHKLMEEVLTGETRDDGGSLRVRAAELIAQQELEDSPDASSWISSPAMAEMVIRTLRRPEIAALRPRLVPEYWVYGSDADGQEVSITAGIADAVAFDDDGRIDVVVDWKSDVNLRERQIRMYREQVRLYLKATGARTGLIVFLGSGHIETVTPGD